MKGIKNENGERKAYTAFGETEFGKMGFGKTGFGETERHRQLCVALTVRQLSPLLHCRCFMISMPTNPLAPLLVHLLILLIVYIALI